MLYGKNTVVSPNLNITGTSCYIDDAFKETSYLAYWNGLMLIMGLCTAVSLVILYYLIGKSIRNHVKAKNKLLIKEDKLKPNVKPKSSFFGDKARDIFGKSKRFGRDNDIKQVDLKTYTINNGINIMSISNAADKAEVDKIERAKDDTKESVSSCNIEIIISNELKEDAHKNVDETKGVNKQEQHHLDTSSSKNRSIQPEEKRTNNVKSGNIRNTNLTTVEEQSVDNGTSGQNTGTTQINRENSRKHREALRNLKRSKRTTQMFFAITILYFVTFIPHLILQVITLTTENFVSSLSFAGQTIYHIVFYCSFLNSMVNCYIYGFYDTVFRDELKKIYSGLRCNEV